MVPETNQLIIRGDECPGSEFYSRVGNIRERLGKRRDRGVCLHTRCDGSWIEEEEIFFDGQSQSAGRLQDKEKVVRGSDPGEVLRG
jgi:hypothetical protein